MACQNFGHDAECGAVDREFIHRVASDCDLVVQAGLCDLREALIFNGFNIVEVADAFGDFGHEEIGGFWFDFVRKWDFEINILRNNLDLIDVAVGDRNDIHCINILDFGGTEID